MHRPRRYYLGQVISGNQLPNASPLNLAAASSYANGPTLPTETQDKFTDNTSCK